MRAGLTEWLDAYGRAWEERDPEAASQLFSEDAIYQWGPFGKKLRGRPLIREAWAEATETQDNVEFRYEVLSASARSGLVRWWCAFDEPTGEEAAVAEAVAYVVGGERFRRLVLRKIERLLHGRIHHGAGVFQGLDVILDLV